MKRVIVIDFSVIRDFGDLKRWDELFPLFTRDDDLIFTAADPGDLNRCKDFFGAKTSIDYIDNNFIAHEALIKSLQKKYERIKDNPENNRFIFWGLPFDLMDELVRNYGSLEDRFRPFGIKNKANIEETFFGNEFYGSYPLDSDGRFLSFDCSDVNFFENFFSYIKNIVNENECLNMRIKEIKKHTGRKLIFETILSGKGGIYDEYSFTAEEMLEMIKAIPECVVEVDLRTCFNSLRTDDLYKDSMEILNNIPKYVEQFAISPQLNKERLIANKAAEQFESVQNKKGVFLNKPRVRAQSVDAAQVKEQKNPAEEQKKRSQTLPAGAAMSSIPSKSEIRFRRERQRIENLQEILRKKLEIIESQKKKIEHLENVTKRLDGSVGYLQNEAGKQKDIIEGQEQIINTYKKDIEKLSKQLDIALKKNKELEEENEGLREVLGDEMEKNDTTKRASNKPEDLDQYSGSSSEEEGDYVRLRF